MTLRNYSNTSVETTLAVGIDAVVTSLTIADATGYPSVPFAIVVDPDVVASEEVLLVTAAAGPLFTVTRAYDGTTGKAHSAGATVIHAAIAADFVERVIASTYATGTLTLAVQPTVGDTITLGALSWVYVSGFPNAGEIDIGSDLAEAQANTVSIVNEGIGATFPDAGAVTFNANVSVIVAAAVGTAGNGVATASVFSDPANVFGQPSLTGGTDGTTSGHIAAQSVALTGSSAATPIVRIVTAPGTDALTTPNIFEIVDSDGNPISNYDGGGNFYTFRDLRMNDPDHNVIFSVSQNKIVYMRVAEADDAFRVVMQATPNDKLLFALHPYAGVTALINAHDAGATALQISTAGVDNTDLIRAYGTVDFNLVFRLMQGGAVVIAQHSAPADGDLNTGDMAIWMDQTPSAAKLMIKAKDSDGTVVTGAVALT